SVCHSPRGGRGRLKKAGAVPLFAGLGNFSPGGGDPPGGQRPAVSSGTFGGGNMIQLLGAVLLLSGAVGFGLKGVARLRGRARTLAAMVSSLELLQSEICDRLTPMPELLELLEQEATYPASAF